MNLSSRHPISRNTRLASSGSKRLITISLTIDTVVDVLGDLLGQAVRLSPEPAVTRSIASASSCGGRSGPQRGCSAVLIPAHAHPGCLHAWRRRSALRSSPRSEMRKNSFGVPSWRSRCRPRGSPSSPPHGGPQSPDQPIPPTMIPGTWRAGTAAPARATASTGGPPAGKWTGENTSARRSSWSCSAITAGHDQAR